MAQRLCFSCGCISGSLFARLSSLLLAVFVVFTSFDAGAQITGTPAVCVGATTTLSATPPGGAWSSSSTFVATVGASSGVVSGVSAGVVTISYVSGGGTATRTVTVNALPTVYLVTGGGGFCAGGTGIHVGTSSSSAGVNYQLYNGASAVGGALAGTGAALDFGLQTVAGTYSVVAVNPVTGCSRAMAGSATISVNPAPSAISGQLAYCPGASGVLSSSPGGGAWTSGTPGVATVGSASGSVTAAAPGISLITYTLPTGCAASRQVTVTAATGAITVPSPVCNGSTATLTDAVAGGTWSSSNTSVATIGSLTGVISGVATGVTTVVYSLGTLTCTTSTTVAVVSGPASITGAASACVGSTISLSDATAGGTWSSAPATVAAISGAGVVTGVSSGTAVISYTVGGCSSTLTITVSSTPALIAGPSLVCSGSSITLTDAVSGGVWSTSSPYLTVGSTTGIVTGVTPGPGSIINYSIGGCFTATTVTVVPVPSSITAPTSICVGAAATVTSVPAGGVWTSSNPAIATIGAGSGVVTGVSSGTFLISYTTGCTVIASMVVNPLSPIIGTPVVCVGQTTHLTDATLGGAWSSSAPGIAAVSGGVVTGVSAGVATIDYSLPSTCAATVIVTVNPLPAAIGGPSSVCVGLTVGETDATPGGTWSSSNPAVATIGSTGTATGVTYGATMISYALSSSTGCIATKTLTVNNVAAAIAGPGTVCLGSTITLTDVGTGSWSSSNPAVGSVDPTGVVSGLALGTTTITFTLATGCYATKTVTVASSPLPVTGPDSICRGASALFSDASGAGLWLSSTLSVATVGSSTGVVTGTGAGTATITYSSGPGCIATRVVTVNPLPGIITGITNICPGTTSLLSDATGGGVWSSSDVAVAAVGSSSGIVTGVAPGSATIYYTIATGCAAPRLFTVSSGPLAIAGFSNICVGTSAAFADPTTGGFWTSSSPGTASVDAFGVVSGIALGTATITYSTGTICPVTFPVTVTSVPSPISGSTSFCLGSTTTLTEAVSGGAWSSSNPGVATVGSASGVVTSVSAGPFMIFYIIGPSCAAVHSMTVNPLPMPITGPDNVCQAQAIPLSDVTPGGAWSSSNPAVGSVDAFGDVTGILPGTISITYTNGFGCTVSLPVTVNVTPTAILGSPISCLGNSNALYDAVGGGTWSSLVPSVATVGSSSGIVTGTGLGTTTIVYTIPSTGCFASRIITVDPLPTAYTVTGGGSRCSADTGVHIRLSGSDASCNYLLYLGSSVAVGTFPGTGAALDFGLQTLAGTYTVKSTSTVTGCTATMTGTATIVVVPSVPASVTIAASPSDTVCAGAAATFTLVPVHGGTAPIYQWNINSLPVSLATSYTYVPANGDVVSVTMTSNAVCPTPNPASDSLTMTVLPFVRPALSLFVTPADTVCQGTPVTVHAVPAYGGASPSYEWLRNGVPSFGGGTYSFVPDNGDVIDCIVTSNYLCLLTGVDTSAPLTVNVDTPVIPSVFIGASPGSTVGRGLPDTFTAYVSNAVAPTYQWYLNDSLIAGATSSTFIRTFSSFVSDSVTCMVTTNGTCRITTFKWIYINVISGIGRLSANGDISLFPNPSKGEFVIRGTLGTLADEEVRLVMTDMLGRVVYEQNLLAKNGALDERIQPGSSLANGMYLLSLHTGTGYKVFHIVIEQ